LGPSLAASWQPNNLGSLHSQRCWPATRELVAHLDRQLWCTLRGHAHGRCKGSASPVAKQIQQTSSSQALRAVLPVLELGLVGAAQQTCRSGSAGSVELLHRGLASCWSETSGFASLQGSARSPAAMFEQVVKKHVVEVSS
jgi:hypothetical protein